MTDRSSTEFEGLLRRALAPVEPPERMTTRLERTLADLTEIAADELEGWELKAMQDPRNWIRPAMAAAVGTAAGAGLVALRVRRQHRGHVAASSDLLDLTGRTLKAVVHETRRILSR